MANPRHSRDPEMADATCRCGSCMEWEDCDRCGGEGFCEYQDTPECWGEDCPSEVNHLVDCPECGGASGWWWCPAAVKEANQKASEG